MPNRIIVDWRVLWSGAPLVKKAHLAEGGPGNPRPAEPFPGVFVTTADPHPRPPARRITGSHALRGRRAAAWECTGPKRPSALRSKREPRSRAFSPKLRPALRAELRAGLRLRAALPALGP